MSVPCYVSECATKEEVETQTHRTPPSHSWALQAGLFRTVGRGTTLRSEPALPDSEQSHSSEQTPFRSPETSSPSGAKAWLRPNEGGSMVNLCRTWFRHLFHQATAPAGSPSTRSGARRAVTTSRPGEAHTPSFLTHPLPPERPSCKRGRAVGGDLIGEDPVMSHRARRSRRQGSIMDGSWAGINRRRHRNQQTLGPLLRVTIYRSSWNIT